MTDDSDLDYDAELDATRRGFGAPLFSMEAADNAEVIPTHLPRGVESMWTTQANPDDVEQVQMSAAAPVELSPEDPRPDPPRNVTGFAVDPGAAWNRGAAAPTPSGAPGAGGVFSAEPVDRDLDLVEEDPYDGVDDAIDGELEDDWSDLPSAASGLFSSGPGTPPAAAGTPGGAPTGPAAGPPPESADPWSSWGGAATPQPPPAAAPPPNPPPHNAPQYDAPPHTAPPDSSAHQPPPFPLRDRRVTEDPTDAVVPDTHGFDVAVSRLRPEDRERARVPLAVCGALLAPGEQVIGVVTGQMLGRPAAVVVTRARVLVVNDRRWKPIVDVFPIDDSLLVRGRRDSHVAALSFSDRDRFSMVDGITEVEVAIGLVDAIRHPAGPDFGGGQEF